MYVVITVKSHLRIEQEMQISANQQVYRYVLEIDSHLASFASKGPEMETSRRFTTDLTQLVHLKQKSTIVKKEDYLLRLGN